MEIKEENLPYGKTMCDFCVHFKEKGNWSFEYECANKNAVKEADTKCNGFEPTPYAKQFGIIPNDPV